jgi:DNA-binding CsgD family transcriptional regulator
MNGGGASMKYMTLAAFENNLSPLRRSGHFHYGRKQAMLRGNDRPGSRIRVNMQQLVLDHGDALGVLTDKQRQVLDLLIQHKTSKEIGRRLGISPHTVDQRIQFAKEKLGARSRSEAAVLYRRLVETYGRTTYEDSGIAETAVAVDQAGGPQGLLPVALLRQRFRSRPSDGPEADFQVVPESFDGRHGTVIRMGAIFGIALFLMLVVLGGLAMFNQLSQLLVK